MVVVGDGGGSFLVITVSHPTFCCVGIGLLLRWGWAVTISVNIHTLNMLPFHLMYTFTSYTLQTCSE